MTCGPLRVVVRPCGNDALIEEGLEQLRQMQAQDEANQPPVNSINVSSSSQSGHCLGLNPNPSGFYWTGLLILAGCVGGAIVIRKVRG